MSDREVDFGSGWRVEAAPLAERWRVTWAGGMLVAVNLTRPHRAELLAANLTLEEARELLRGWQEHHDQPNSLAWAILAGAGHGR